MTAKTRYVGMKAAMHRHRDACEWSEGSSERISRANDTLRADIAKYGELYYNALCTSQGADILANRRPGDAIARARSASIPF
jgi:hypothetical protein